MPAKTDKNITINHLTRGKDYLAQHPDFKLVGRDADLNRLAGILMRANANNALVIGPAGVGCSALTMGLQASKDNGATLDILGKRFYWLDTDGLFSSSDTKEISEKFQKIIATLNSAPDTVLVVKDTKSFVEGARNSGCTHLINALMSEIKKPQLQAIFEVRDSDLETVLKCHPDIMQDFTTLDLREPDPESLRLIIDDAAARLERHHKITISPEARQTAIELTNKYRVDDLGLSQAQPSRSATLIDRAATAFRQKAHTRPPALDGLESQLSAVNAAIGGGDVPELKGQSKNELESRRAALESDIRETMESWASIQKELRAVYSEQRNGEEFLRELENERDTLREKKKTPENAESGSAPPPPPQKPKGFNVLNKLGAAVGSEGADIDKVNRQIGETEQAIAANMAHYETLRAQIDNQLVLGRDHVLAEFSSISGISVNKLTRDETARLRNLHTTLSNRVFDQDDAVTRLSNAVKKSRSVLKKLNKPAGAFLFLGPSGVGKTEIAKALAAALYDDERTLLRFDMSEYMEKHAAAKLIGAPPGYEGYEVGGILTNAVRRNPVRVILFDEIEKAHPDVFDLFLQILDDARLTDNRGLTVDFSQSIIIMTSNVGTPFFLDDTLDFETAKAEAMKKVESTYRGEFLNRLNGKHNIVCFNRLGLPTIERIATRELGTMNAALQEKGLMVHVSPEDLAALCRDHYTPAQGARGIPGYFSTYLEPPVVDVTLFEPDAKGVMQVHYDKATQTVTVDPPKPAAVNAANENRIVPAPASAAKAFNHS